MIDKLFKHRVILILKSDNEVFFKHPDTLFTKGILYSKQYEMWRLAKALNIELFRVVNTHSCGFDIWRWSLFIFLS